MNLDDLQAMISSTVMKVLEQVFPEGFGQGQDGYIVPGSYDPTKGTVSVRLLCTDSMIPSNIEAPVDYLSVPLLITAHGQQAGPVGNERVLIIQSHSGPLALLWHYDDDSPNAPAGEHWLTHKTGSSIKLKNSGNVNISQGSGGYVLLGGATHTAGLAVVRISDLDALYSFVNSHIHTVTGGTTSAPTTSITEPAGSPSTFSA